MKGYQALPLYREVIFVRNIKLLSYYKHNINYLSGINIPLSWDKEENYIKDDIHIMSYRNHGMNNTNGEEIKDGDNIGKIYN